MGWVAFRCLSCKRGFKDTVDELLEHLRRFGRPRCKMCGGPLDLPAELEAEHARRFGGQDLGAEAEAPCTGCPRVIRESLRGLAERVLSGRTRCQYCASPFSYPAVLVDVLRAYTAPARQRSGVRVACPVCAADALLDELAASAVLRCGHCQASFRGPSVEGGPLRQPSLDGEPAPAAVVVAAFGAYCVATSTLARIVTQLLEARATQAEVTPSEAAELGELVGSLAAWKPDGRPVLPLPLEEAATLTLSLLFPGLPARREKTALGLDLVFRVGEGTAFTAAGAWNVVNLFTASLLGVGVLLHEPGLLRQTERRLRVSLVQGESGVELQLASQTDDGRPAPAGAKAHAELGRTIAGTSPQLSRYYALRALFGPFARGATPLHATPETIARRAHALRLAPELAAALQPVG